MAGKRKCPRCNWTWIPRVPNPVSCPECHTRLGTKAITQREFGLCPECNKRIALRYVSGRLYEHNNGPEKCPGSGEVVSKETVPA